MEENFKKKVGWEKKIDIDKGDMKKMAMGDRFMETKALPQP